jgi:zinc transporter 1/2/3
MDSTTPDGDAPADTSAPESGSAFTVTIDCDSGNEYDGRMGLRISAIFVILVGSLLGTLLPIVLARSARLQVPKMVFFVTKFFGSGVIIATAFIHLLAPAVEALGSPCLDPDSAIAQYSWPEGICLMTVFAMFFIELLASRYDILGTGRMGMQGAKAYDPALDLIRSSGKEHDEEGGNGKRHPYPQDPR